MGKNARDSQRRQRQRDDRRDRRHQGHRHRRRAISRPPRCRCSRNTIRTKAAPRVCSASRSTIRSRSRSATSTICPAYSTAPLPPAPTRCRASNSSCRSNRSCSTRRAARPSPTPAARPSFTRMAAGTKVGHVDAITEEGSVSPPRAMTGDARRRRARRAGRTDAARGGHGELRADAVIGLCRGLPHSWPASSLHFKRSAQPMRPSTFPTARYLVGDLQERIDGVERERAAPKLAHRNDPRLSVEAGRRRPVQLRSYMHQVRRIERLYARQRERADDALAAMSLSVVDSFATRGLEQPAPRVRATPAGRCVRRIDVLCRSSPSSTRGALPWSDNLQGGIAALRRRLRSTFEIFAMPDGLRVQRRHSLPSYPSCSAAADQLAIPALVLIGALDDWTPPVRCDWWMQRRQGKGAPVRLVVFPGAYHAFDKPGLRDGKWSFGHWLKYDAEATVRANVAMHDFLAAQLAE